MRSLRHRCLVSKPLFTPSLSLALGDRYIFKGTLTYLLVGLIKKPDLISWGGGSSEVVTLNYASGKPSSPLELTREVVLPGVAGTWVRAPGRAAG